MKNLILGGARSGKSNYAQELANKFGRRIVFIATAMAEDIEMQERIIAHKHQRPENWKTVEEPFYLSRVIKECKAADCILVDCLGFWVSNLLLKNVENFATQKQEFLCAVQAIKTPIVLVSNEVGMGIVPTTTLARCFRDEIGLLHQRLASICDHVVLMTAGLPQQLK